VKYFLVGLTMLVSILLIVVVVAQESKQPGMGSSIGGGAEAMAGGRTRGKDAVLSKFTVIFGIIFAVLCLVLGRYMNTF
jgi:preprotein translocase subunit SecG